MTGRGHTSSGEASAFGWLFVCMGGGLVSLLFFRDAIPPEWRNFMRQFSSQVKPPVEDWQAWTVATGVLLIGWRLIVVGGRFERAERDRRQAAEKDAGPPGPPL
jgi:hypothetical protein